MNLYLFLDNDKVSTTYGIGTYLKELTNAVVGTDIKVHIVYLHSIHQNFTIEKSNHIEHWFIPEIRHNNQSKDIIRQINDYHSNVFYLLRFYIKESDNLIFHFNQNHYGLLAKELKKQYNCKTVATIHFASYGFDILGSFQKLRTIKAKFEKQRSEAEQEIYIKDEKDCALFNEVDRMITPTQYMKNILHIEYQVELEKIAVIPNGLNDAKQIQLQDRENLRKKWRIPEEEFIILFVGRLSVVKGLRFLIEAFRKVLVEYPNCRLMIAGNGKYERYIQNTKDLCTKITFTGFLDKEEVYELYQISNVGVVPSLFEPFGYVAVEMMIHKLPIIATSNSGLNEVIDDSCGLKVPIIELSDRREIDSTLLAQNIIHLLQHPVKAKTMGENGRKRYLQKFSSEVFRRNILNYYNSLYI